MNEEDNLIVELKTVEALNRIGIKTDGSRFQLQVRSVLIPISVDLSAVDPTLVLECLIQQIYTAGHSRGHDAHKAELQRFLGIRS